MGNSLNFLRRTLLLLTILTIPHLSASQGTQHKSQPHGLEHLLAQLSHWGKHQLELQKEESRAEYRIIIAWILSFIAASVSSAGGVGGGSLYLPILNLVAGLDLKSSTSYSAFMVTSGSLSNVLYNILFTSPGPGGKSLINYEICLLSEPCMLLGVSIGVVCNVMFPEWLITALFAAFLASSTYKTCSAGFKCWRLETEEVRRGEAFRLERGGNEVDEKEMEEPLLGGGAVGGLRVPWKDLAVLLMIWLCFFVLHVLLGDEAGKGVVNIKPCGVAYWLITLSQVPFAIVFTAYILYDKKKRRSQPQSQQDVDGKDVAAETKMEALPMFVFPSAALFTGVLGGLFGIGGGLLINPVLLQIGIPPRITAATTTFIVLFSASMSMVQYAILGMKGIGQASIYAAVSFVASALGLAVVEKAIEKSGRVSIIVFMVSMVMVLSTVSITCFGAIDVWRQYTTGSYMGFKPPC
ncbi:sulfite exporter TauE/SafE family protein 5 [Cocos nucifera]|uniref:Sulfite exporter TauE/SafE family protein 5 n=1 Tax=Cocos nucifera TaxID=13894 RepID=A0A8K0N2U4_COCNU|nr:sulfite exporter TauE/SafE family protein 5 [Cocos nucifera]